MPVTLTYQVFPQATYDWGSLASTNAPLQINTALETWVAACNANAGNTLKQLTIHKKPTDGNTNSTMPDGSTNSSYTARRGWVIQANNTATKGLIFYFAGVRTAASSIDNYEFYVTEINGWTNSNNHTNGYGLFTNAIAAWSGNINFTGSTFNYINRGTSSQFLIAYSSDPNQEFFCLGINGNPSSSSYTATWIIYKDNLNNWGANLINNSGVSLGGISLDNSLYPASHWLFNNSTSNSRLNSVIITTSSTLAGVGNGQNSPSVVRRIAHPNVFSSDNSTTRFSFGAELIANSRRFYGMSNYYLVIER